MGERKLELFADVEAGEIANLALARELRRVVEERRRWKETDSREGRRAVLPSRILDRLNLSGLDLRGADLWGAELAHCRLRGARLEDARLDWAMRDGADLPRTAPPPAIARMAGGRDR